MTSISIAMGTYNSARFLREQLESLATQTKLPFELVVTDDGSGDATMELLEDFAKTARFPVRIYRNEQNLGFRANFIKCAGLCRGDLIAFCDHDDIWLPEKLEIQSAFFHDPNMMMVHHNAYLIASNGDDLGLLIWLRPKQQEIVDWMELPPWFNVPGFTQLFRRDILSATALWPMSLSAETANQPLIHDQFVTFISNSLGKVGYIDRPLAKYRQHDHNAIGWQSGSPSFLRRLRYRLENRVDVFERAEQSAAQRAAILDHFSQHLDGDQKETALLASRRWSELGALYGKRRVSYTHGILGRASALIELILKGAYSEKGYWTFSRKSLLKDGTLGVLLGPVTMRYGFRQMHDGGDPICRRGKVRGSKRGV